MRLLVLLFLLQTLNFSLEGLDDLLPLSRLSLQFVDLLVPGLQLHE